MINLDFSHQLEFVYSYFTVLCTRRAEIEIVILLCLLLDLDERIIKQQEEEEERKRLRRERKKEKKVSMIWFSKVHLDLPIHHWCNSFLSWLLQLRYLFIYNPDFISSSCISMISLESYFVWLIVDLFRVSEREGSRGRGWGRCWCCSYDGIWGLRFIQKVIMPDPRFGLPNETHPLAVKKKNGNFHGQHTLLLQFLYLHWRGNQDLLLTSYSPSQCNQLFWNFSWGL